MSLPPSVTVAGLLGSRPEMFGLPLEVLAGVHGLDRVITSPHIQKTGLALAGFHEYLKPGRVLILDRKSTRLNSSHQIISYAVFCLKKKSTYDSHTRALLHITMTDAI